MAWYFAANAEELSPPRAVIVTVNRKEIGVFAVNGEYYAALNHCPHSGAPICQGKVTGAVTSAAVGDQDYDHARPVLRCPWHHWEFDLRDGNPLAPIRQRIKTYPVRVENGQVWVEM